MLSFRAVISYSALQVAAIKRLFHFYLSPAALDQINFVLVLISTNHNARYLYPEMDISRTVEFYQELEIRLKSLEMVIFWACDVK